MIYIYLKTANLYFKDYLQSLTYPIIDSCDSLTSDDIVLFINRVPDININYKYAIINMEQLNKINVLPYLKSYGAKIGDYSLGNKTFMSELIYLPYQINLSEIVKLETFLNCQKEYDVVFNGNMTPRRKEIVTLLKRNNIKVFYKKVFDDERDAIVGKSKILLNVHCKTQFNTFESLRCDRWIMSGHVIVSESSINDDDYDLRELYIKTDYNNLLSCIQNTLSDYDAIKQNLNNKLRNTFNVICNNRNVEKQNFETQIKIDN